MSTSLQSLSLHQNQYAKAIDLANSKNSSKRFFHLSLMKNQTIIDWKNIYWTSFIKMIWPYLMSMIGQWWQSFQRSRVSFLKLISDPEFIMTNKFPQKTFLLRWMKLTLRSRRNSKTSNLKSFLALAAPNQDSLTSWYQNKRASHHHSTTSREDQWARSQISMTLLIEWTRSTFEQI